MLLNSGKQQAGKISQPYVKPHDSPTNYWTSTWAGGKVVAMRHGHVNAVKGGLSSRAKKVKLSLFLKHQAEETYRVGNV